MKKILILLFILLNIFADAQNSKLNITLKQEIQKITNKNQLFPLFVIGDVQKIKTEVRKLEGEYQLSAKNIIQIKIPVKDIVAFSENNFVQSIPYSFSKGVALNDTMVIHNNVVPVFNGDAPLHQPYTGKGVLFGIIDTGHDIDHPDFKDSLGNTRIIAIWDQVAGVKWDSASINNGTCTHNDYSGTSHGTHVSGIAVGNGLALNKYRGVAPEASIVAVASDFNAPNWLFTVVDAVDYIYHIADSLNMPCVINASIGDYFGSHDGTDPAAVLIDSLVNYKSGRAFVCAVGNAGFFNWHVGQTVTADTSFTWLKYNPTSGLGYGSVFYEVWSDTANFNNVNYAFGANLPSGSFQERGSTPFFNIQNRLGNFTDTIKNGSNVLGIVQTFGELQGDKYLLQVLLNEPDSNTYYFSIKSTGSGKFDFWSTSLLGTSDIVETGLPTVSQYPPMAFYTLPDSSETTVSSFSCLPSVITVGNFVNRSTYIDVDSILRITTDIPGKKAYSTSIGPDRRGNIKPDIGATGDNTIGPNSAAVIAANLASTPANRAKVALGGMHRLNGGTSMASPVVAGVSALYLEKCPNATMAEIKNAILSTAKQDTFTGVVPNPVFGYGKVDAFAATLGQNQNICDGDSVQISSPNYNNYLWFNNDTSQSIFVDTSIQNIFVVSTNSSGCKGYSDTIQVVWHPLPTKPTVTVVGSDSLIYVSNLNLQWYYNNNNILGATDTLHIAQNNGNYFVQVTDSFGCNNYSDTVNVILLGIENPKSNVATIYPNPTKNKINIELKNKTITQINLLDALGKLLIHKTIQHNVSKISIDMQHLPNGVYFLQIDAENNNYRQKVILLR